MKPVGEMTPVELAAYVCGHLRAHGIDAVLSGGGCVTLYTGGDYVSYDLDFIENLATSRQKLTRVMQQIGFLPKDRYYRHPDTPFFVEFPTGPLCVGNEPPRDIRVLHLPTGDLSVLSPTDAIKDRLAAFYHWNDRQCFDQALDIARQNRADVDLAEVERWSRAEGSPEKFALFLQALG